MVCPKNTELFTPVLEEGEYYQVAFSDIFVYPVLKNLQGRMFHAVFSILLCALIWVTNKL